ncbi:UNVERIFIED_CONTAM: Long chain acyl-CoA synthetase 2 [Sesamum radiatum]|uniref:Long chain acyl-CoA synthetase 2 n=1 Tax=Sesamum radiatum TaxID=300843 RepID=A0AAW2MTD5_SESRA
MGDYVVKVEEGRDASHGKPSAGPVYRCIYAKDGLLDIPTKFDSPWNFFSESVKKNPNNQMLGRRQIKDGKGDKCGIYGANCPEWIMAMEACIGQSIIYVPLYDTLGANAVEFIINHAEVSIAFVQENKLLPVPDKQKETAEELGVACFSWEEFALLGDLDENLPPKKKTDTCTIMYTSGTTGEPKGVILTSAAFMAEVLSMDQLLLETDKVDIRFLIEDLIVLKPTIFCGVPRVYDRIYTGIMDKISASGALRKSLFQIAYNYKLRNLEKGLRQEEASPFFDKLVFDKIRQGFGGRVRLMLSGAAPLPKHIEEFLRVTCCCVLSQGYVGVPMTTIEARLESVPEMGYDALSSVPRGEICLRGSTLFSGYHKRPDLTAEVVIDGWFHTGDVGEWQPNGALKIIDRKKNIFKLSQGEYVAVESIESVYSRCPLITSIWVYGNSFESFLVAVVVPERKALEEWAANNQEKGDFQSLCSNIKARKYILDELNSTAKTHNLRGFEMLRGVHLEPVPFGIDRDLVTPTFKLKRPQLLTYYKECIDQLYSEAKGTKA